MLDPNVNGFLLWTISQYVQDQEAEKGDTRTQDLNRVAAVGAQTGDFTREDVDLACTLYPGRECSAQPALRKNAGRFETGLTDLFRPVEEHLPALSAPPPAPPTPGPP